MAFLFKHKRDIDRVLATVRGPETMKRPKVGVKELARLSEGFIFKTPSGGITGVSGTTCGSADCTPYYIDTDDELVELLNNEGASQTVPVKNPFATAIGNSTYITAKLVFGVLVVDAEDCG